MKKPCLLMIPGTLCDQRVFALQARRLRKTADIRFLDLTRLRPNAGWLDKLLNSLPAQFSIAGFSLGGLLGLELLRRAPERVTGLALIASNAEGASRMSKRRSAVMRRQWRQLGPGALVQQLLPAYFHHELQCRRRRELVCDMAVRTPRRAAFAEFAWAASRHASFDLLAKFDRPLLLISGAHDQICPAALQRRIVGVQPAAQWLELPRCAHFLTLEAPAKVSAALLTWLCQEKSSRPPSQLLTQESSMFSPDQLRQRFIAFDSLEYSTDAFIDYRIPGCGPKKNYALIGAGVSQNPDQPVALQETHGFQVGGVSMPAGVVNPPHMHFTAEVFICTNGRWELHWGFNPDAGVASFGEGDICSIPTWIYRGFKNIDDHDGFMFTALGGDDTGGILWGPQTLEAARQQGVHLTDDYQIIDEQLGGRWEPSMRRLEPMTPAEVGQLRHWSLAQMAGRIVKFADLQWSSNALFDAVLPGCGGQLAPVIGHGMSADRNQLAPVMNAHGFSIEWLKIPARGCVSMHRLTQKQVLICKSGSVELEIAAQAPEELDRTRVTIKGSADGWDTYSMPGDVWRTYRNSEDTDALLVVMTPGDGRKLVQWAPAVNQAAARSGIAIDANGYLAPKRFVDRAQH